MTHPHLDALIRKWRDHEHAGDSSWGAGYMAAMKDCADDLAQALAALPGGGVDVDEAMTDRACAAYEGMTKGFCATHKQAMFYALKTALSPTPPPTRPTAMADLLRMDYINSLPQPFMATLYGGSRWPVHDIDVQTGLTRIDVCGKLDVLHFADVRLIEDDAGRQHDPETFYSDYEADRNE